MMEVDLISQKYLHTSELSEQPFATRWCQTQRGLFVLHQGDCKGDTAGRQAHQTDHHDLQARFGEESALRQNR